MCIPFIRHGKDLCIHSVIAAAKLGVMCVAWLNENPAIFIIAWIPQIWKSDQIKGANKRWGEERNFSFFHSPVDYELENFFFELNEIILS